MVAEPIAAIPAEFGIESQFLGADCAVGAGGALPKVLKRGVQLRRPRKPDDNIWREHAAVNPLEWHRGLKGHVLQGHCLQQLTGAHSELFRTKSSEECCNG